MIEPRVIADGEKVDRAGVFVMPINHYHGDCCVGPSISSSGLRRIFSDSPMEFWIECALNPSRIPQKDKVEWVIGRGTHHVALSEPGFAEKFCIQPEKAPDGRDWNGNNKTCKEWLAAKRAAGLTVLTRPQVEQIRGMAGLLPWQKDLPDSGLANSHMVISGGLLSGLIEHSIIWKDKETGIWLRSRPDAISESDTLHCDLKTTQAVGYDSLQRSAFDDYRYDMQAGLARIGMREVCGVDLTNFAFVFVAKTPPHAVQVVEVKSGAMDEAEKDIRVALRTFAHCLETKQWPGPCGQQNDAIYIEMSPWGRKRADDRRAFLESELAA